jgi:signal transduction histidine kinase
MESAAKVLCYSGEVRQVFANLIGNALDACGSSGRLQVRTRDAVHPRTDAAGVRVTIADNGCGMSAETRERVFEPFYTTKGMNGTGLGMWVSFEILDRHCATVQLKSRLQPRGGTVYSIFFVADPDIVAPGE